MSDDSALAIWSAEEQDIIRSVIAPDLTDPELRFFAQVCRATGLNPIMQQIHAIKRNAYNSQTKQNEPKLTIQTSIHGLRLIADRTRCYAPGQRPTFETRPDGSLLSATAYVKKLAGGVWHEVEDTAYWDEYVQTKDEWLNNTKTGRQVPVALWASKPHVMLAKCAEALALRRAFPAEMAGVYTDDEMPLVETEPAPPPTARELSGQPERKPPARPAPAPPVKAALVQRLVSAMKAANADPIDTAGTARLVFNVTRWGDLTPEQIEQVIDLVEDRRELRIDEHGTARLVPVAGLASLDDVPFEVATAEV